MREMAYLAHLPGALTWTPQPSVSFCLGCPKKAGRPWLLMSSPDHTMVCFSSVIETMSHVALQTMPFKQFGVCQVTLQGYRPCGPSAVQGRAGLGHPVAAVHASQLRGKYLSL